MRGNSYLLQQSAAKGFIIKSSMQFGGEDAAAQQGNYCYKQATFGNPTRYDHEAMIIKTILLPHCEGKQLQIRASLQADRERELKSLEEARGAKQAALAEERQVEEEARRKLEEEQEYPDQFKGFMELERLLVAKEATLPAEPSADDNNVVNLVVYARW